MQFENQKQINMIKAKVISIVSLILVLGLAAWFYFSFYFVHKEGAEYGNLTYCDYKGIVFKTYEGRIITSGIKSVGEGQVQSNELLFSVEDPVLGDSLMNHLTGKNVRLHYKVYFHPLIWRGESRYVVDKIVAVDK